MSNINTSIQNVVIGYVGMTHLGLNYAGSALANGFTVYCFDQNPDLIKQLETLDFPINEPGLLEIYKAHKQNVNFTSDIKTLEACNLIYVSVDVKTNDSGESDLSEVKSLLFVAAALITKQKCLIVLSQIPPGFIRELAIAKDNLFYQVETLIFGKAVDQALYPERIIVGCGEPNKPLPEAYQTFLDSYNCPVLKMKYESAELTKIAINCCLVSSISVANTLGELCEKIGARWSEIASALRLDKRIGKFSYLSPGLGIAGGNLERDLATIEQFADRYGTDKRVVSAWIANSKYRRDWALKVLHNNVCSKIKDPKIGILGLAYKENTHSTKNSPAIALINSLHKFNLRVFDPVVSANVVESPVVKGCETALDVAREIDVLIVMTPWSQFKELSIAALAKLMKNKIIIDPYRVFDMGQATIEGFEYYCLGEAN